MASLAERYEAACRVVLLIVVVSAATVLFTLRGAVIAGFFPAVAAAHTVYRARLLDADGDRSLRRAVALFARSWREEFPRANAPGRCCSVRPRSCGSITGSSAASTSTGSASR